MSDGILKDVLKLEKQIEADLSREQERADAWCSRACRLVDEEMNCAQTEGTQTFERQGIEAVRSARRSAAAALRRERLWLRRLASLDDDSLLPLLDRQLIRVITGRDDDCPDDQS